MGPKQTGFQDAGTLAYCPIFTKRNITLAIFEKASPKTN